MVSDLVTIERLGSKRLGENQRLRTHLKRHNFPERRLRKVAQEVEEAIDCRACANCCRVAETQLNARDVERLAKHFRVTPKEFLQKYAAQSSAGEETVLRRTEAGCVFLDGNDCLIYEIRPDTCRNFPHLVRGAGSLESRMWHMPDRATYCPIAYNTLEIFKEITGFQK